jgi:monoamine oxidase
MKQWDLIIVGAGPAGLTMAYRILQEKPETRILILERSGKVGGRTRTLTFAGKTELPCGAGVGRTHKDHRLSQWLQTMGFQKNTWVSHPTTQFLTETPFSMSALISRLKQAVRPTDARRTFREFAQEVLSPPEFQWFQSAMGYTDYLDADAWETVHYYGFEDNIEPLHGFTVPWTALAETTYNVLKQKGCRFYFHTDVKRIFPEGSRQHSHSHLRQHSRQHSHSHSRPLIKIKASSNRHPECFYEAHSVVVATPVESLRRLFPATRAYRRDALSGQPFMRLYATLNTSGRAFMATHAHPSWHSGMAMVPGALQKISVLDESKGIYRLAYADNAHARELHRLLKKKHPEIALTQTLQSAFQSRGVSAQNFMDRWKACEWFPTGTHYYPPLPEWAPNRESFIYEAQHPLTPAVPIWVVGEAVSRDQGWTEGALDSVDRIFPEWILYFSKKIIIK